jgi:hypothetical protein
MHTCIQWYTNILFPKKQIPVIYLVYTRITKAKSIYQVYTRYIPCLNFLGFPDDTYPFWSLISLGHASGFLNSCIVFANEDSFAHSICKKDLASRRQSMMALGKRWFGFRRFKKCWRAFATRAKAHRLDQNRQSLAYKAQRSNHWAKNANLTYQDVNHCDYKV